MTKPVPVLKTLLSAWLTITTGYGIPELYAANAIRQGNVVIPESSQVRAEDLGLQAHTDHVILAPEAAPRSPDAMSLEPEVRAETAAAPIHGSPAWMRSVYKLPSTGGAGVIAIVDAYDYPSAQHDLTTFSAQFGLPACTTANGCFHQVYASGVKPAGNCSWAQEEALDVEWAHAMAPDAKIVLVEAKSSGSTDMMKAVDVASAIVNPSGHGFGEVSMSWGFGEFSSETSLDAHFRRQGVVYVASAGDVGGKRNYPATSPYVVAAGGTSLHFNAQGQLQSETAWNDAGGGPSPYEARPAYQTAIVEIVAGHRGTPDVSFDADPNSGAWVYDSTSCGGLAGWLMFGGTSLSSPSIAGIVNLAGHFYSSGTLELDNLYSHLGTADFRDITLGQAGSFKAAKGWDFATGVGTSVGVVGK
ncbi:MAG TPA: S53 family peptidase [Terriglobia bacterium]|nr:S53 family peptidase [Terriglobia bacterium]